MEKWRLVSGIVADGDFIDLEGLNPWEFTWNQTDEPAIMVDHPQYKGQKHNMNIYTINNGEKVVRFAAGEFSNTAWGFYLPI